MPKTNNKGKGRPQALEFHYFSLNAVSNGDGTVTVSFFQVEPVPEGMIVKTVSVLRRDGAVDPNQGPITWDNIIKIGGAGPFNEGDRIILPQELTDIPPLAGTYTYNVNGTYGIPGDNASQFEMGSNWVPVTV